MMVAAQLPVSIQILSAAAIFATGVFLVAAHAALAAWAAPRSSLGPDAQARVPFLVGGFLATWLAVALLVSDTALVPSSGLDARRGLTLLVGFGPMLAALFSLYRSRTIGALYAAMPASWLIRIQAYRMAGLMFLFPFLYYGVVPAGFAVPAAIGDFLTGLAAPAVAAAVERRHPRASRWAVAWNLFGILDLIVAPVAAVLSRAQVISIHPIALVPLFIGPPLGILTHLYSLRSLSRAAQGEAHRHAPPAEELRMSHA
jgi:hypothetical protein